MSNMGRRRFYQPRKLPEGFGCGRGTVQLWSFGQTGSACTNDPVTTAAATCLALNVYFEARGESYDGQKMIAEVTMERVYTDGFPKTVCGVVWEDGALSWTNDGKSDRLKDIDAWLQPRSLPIEVLLYGQSLIRARPTTQLVMRIPTGQKIWTS